MDHSTKQTIADVVKKGFGAIALVFFSVLGGKKAVKKIREKRAKKD